MDLTTDKFTVGVFQDAASAEKGIEALVRHNFAADTLTIIARHTPEVTALMERLFGTPPASREIKELGPAVARGPLVEALNGSDDQLFSRGIAASMRRAGFQSHDGAIFERLAARGGVLVGVASEARASEALSTLHAYGGGNAAIGAWTGRV